jgi:hypothetical protein
MQTRSEAYLQTAERAHKQAESALSPQEKHLLLEIERSLRKLAEIEEWQNAIGHDKRECERPFASFELFRGRNR